MSTQTKTPGERLKELRKERGLTQERVSQATGLSVKTVFNCESVPGHPVRRMTKLVLANYYGVSVDDVWKQNP